MIRGITMITQNYQSQQRMAQDHTISTGITRDYIEYMEFPGITRICTKPTVITRDYMRLQI